MTIIQNLIHIDISNWSTLGAYGNQDGYSITVFVLMYIIGVVVRMENKNDVSIFRYIIGFIICVAFNSFIFFVQNKYQFVPALNGYFNPFTVMGSFCLLKIFSSLEIKTDWICKTLKWFAEGSLMVLLASGKFIEKLNVEKYATGGV